jgi:hypothetical protein
MYMRNRYYDPATGRFTQQDPIGLAGGLNLYGFANGDPVNFSDPFGLRACEDPDEPCPVKAEVGVASGVGGSVKLGPIRGEAQLWNVQIGAQATGDVTAIWSMGLQLEVGSVGKVGAFIEIEIAPNPDIRGVPGVVIGGEHGAADPTAFGFEISRPGAYASLEVSPRGILNYVSDLVARTESWLEDRATAYARTQR